MLENECECIFETFTTDMQTHTTVKKHKKQKKCTIVKKQQAWQPYNLILAFYSA